LGDWPATIEFCFCDSFGRLTSYNWRFLVLVYCILYLLIGFLSNQTIAINCYLLYVRIEFIRWIYLHTSPMNTDISERSECKLFWM
jgi:hypothetical protein